MNLLTMEHITKAYTDRVLLDDVAFGINENEKVFYMLHSGLTFAGGITCHTGAGIIITERLRCII